PAAEDGPGEGRGAERGAGVLARAARKANSGIPAPAGSPGKLTAEPDDAADPAFAAAGTDSWWLRTAGRAAARASRASGADRDKVGVGPWSAGVVSTPVPGSSPDP